MVTPGYVCKESETDNGDCVQCTALNDDLCVGEGIACDINTNLCLCDNDKCAMDFPLTRPWCKDAGSATAGCV